jgi:hypothetical protein
MLVMMVVVMLMVMMMVKRNRQITCVARCTRHSAGTERGMDMQKSIPTTTIRKKADSTEDEKRRSGAAIYAAPSPPPPLCISANLPCLSRLSSTLLGTLCHVIPVTSTPPTRTNAQTLICSLNALAYAALTASCCPSEKDGRIAREARREESWREERGEVAWVRRVERCRLRIMVPMAREMEPPRTRDWPTAPWAAAGGVLTCVFS